MKKVLFVFAAVAALLLASCSNASGGSSSTADGGGGTGTQPGTGQPESEQIDPALTVPLTLEAIDAGAVVTFCNKAEGAVTYKVNGGEAQTIASGETKAITLANAGDKVAFYGDNDHYSVWDMSKGIDNCSNISCSSDCYIYGNIMSLIKSDGFAKLTELLHGAEFTNLFKGNIHIKNKDDADLLLPAKKLGQWNAYYGLFEGCSGLTKAPTLPATEIFGCCYERMFADCANLTVAPALPAVTMADYCYKEMFKGCAKLAKAPALPATVMSIYCYYGMFDGCSNLVSAPELPATTLAEKCYNSMFKECINLTTAPALQATTLAKECYCLMFSGCAKLESITCLATDITPQHCVADWTKGVAAAGTFTRAVQMHDWLIGSSSGIPNGWEVKGGQEPTGAPLTLEAVSSAATVTFVNKAAGPVWYKINGGEKQTIASGETKEIALAAAGDKVAFYGNNPTYCTQNGQSNIACSAPCYVYGNIMSLVSSSDYDYAKKLFSNHTFSTLFQGNANIKNKDGEDLRLPATTLTRMCYGAMFDGCSGLTKAPELPATKLDDIFYEDMFEIWSSLTTAPSLQVSTLV
ncbi:MAG: hypothetical protein J5700_01785 [Treponema sp.]|nr:hypothetical protein [Treponema sp.]